MELEKHLFRVIVKLNGEKIRIGDFPSYGFGGAIQQASMVDSTGEVPYRCMVKSIDAYNAYTKGNSKKYNVFVKDNGKVSKFPDYIEGDHLSLINNNN